MKNVPEDFFNSSTLYIEEDDVESLKLVGVFSEFGYSVPTQPFSRAPQISRACVYGKAPVLSSPHGTYELFWNVILFLDQHFWNSELVLGDPNALNALFSMIEECDHLHFPVLEEAALKMPSAHSSSRSSSYMLTHLLQWIFMSQRQKEETRRAAKRAHMRVPNISPVEVLSSVEELLERGSTLPKLHHAILQGTVKSVIAWVFEKVPSLKHQQGKKPHLRNGASRSDDTRRLSHH